MTTYRFNTLQNLNTYLEFRADSSVDLTLPTLVYRSPCSVLCLLGESTDTHLRHTQVLVRFDQK